MHSRTDCSEAVVLVLFSLRAAACFRMLGIPDNSVINKDYQYICMCYWKQVYGEDGRREACVKF